MKLSKKEKEEIAERMDIAISTFYKWEKTKPELIKLIVLGLEKEKEIENNFDSFKNIDDAVGKMLPMIKELENKVKKLEEKNI